MQVLLKLLRLNLGCDLLGRPCFKGQRACCKLKVTVPFNVLVPDNWLHGGVRVVNQELVNRLQGHFVLVLIVVGVKA